MAAGAETMSGSRYDRCIRQYDEIFAAEAANVPSVASTETRRSTQGSTG